MKLLFTRSVYIVDNNDSFVYNIVEILKTLEINYLIRMHDEVLIDEIAPFTHIIFSPGPSTPSEFPIMRRILDRYALTHRILGVCLGHQAIAEYYGAELEQLSHPLHGHSSQLHIDHSNTSPLFSGIEEQTPIGRYHSWVVSPSTLPDELRLTAHDETGNIMALQHRSMPIFGTQFHPESIITQEGVRMIRNFCEL